MIVSIKEFFNQFIEPGTRAGSPGSEQALQIAAAALLLEMMRMDDRLAEEERNAMVTALQRQFDLDLNQIEALIAHAGEEANRATDYFQFTSLINKSCDVTQKIRIIENMWHVAMSDRHLDAHELHLMRKIADLLYIGHAEYVAAKQRVREALDLPAE